jgi:hypothetical protein
VVSARWALVPVAALSGWFATLLLAMWFHGYAEEAWCPPGDYISGQCYDQAVIDRLHDFEMVYAALSALVSGGAAVVAAPAHRLAVTWGMFAVGSAVCAYLAHLGEWRLTTAAVGGGFIGALLITAIVKANDD